MTHGRAHLQIYEALEDDASGWAAFELELDEKAAAVHQCKLPPVSYPAAERYFDACKLLEEWIEAKSQEIRNRA